MKIFVFERPDGTQGADYSEEFCKRQGRLVRTVELPARREMELAVANDPLPRVRALAQRALKEHLARNQQPEPQITWSPAMATVKDRRFFGRLKWVFFGR